MRDRIITLAMLALIGVLLIGTPVLAYIYRATYTVTSANVSAYEMLGVTTDNDTNNQWMADNGFMNSTANDTRIETLGGLEKPHMITDNATFTAIPVPANSQTNLYFTTGNSEQDFYIIPGYGGYVTVADNTTLELGDNFTVTQSGWVPTDNGTDKNLIYKDLAFKTAVSRITDEEIFSTIIGGDTDNLDFVAASNDWVQVPDHADFSFTAGGGDDEPFSLVAWVNFDDASSGTIISKWDENADECEWVLKTDVGDLLEFYCGDPDASETLGRETAAITGYEGAWTHIVATYDGSKVVAGFNIYLDGVVSDTASIVGGAYAGMTAGVQDVNFGSTQNGVGNVFDGGLAEIRVYDIELSQTQALADFHGEPLSTNLVGLWRIDEGAGNPLDTSGNEHDGVNNGADWDTDFDNRYKPVVTATGIESGEHTVKTLADTIFFYIEHGIMIWDDYAPQKAVLNFNAPLFHTELKTSPFTSKDVNELSGTVNDATWTSDGYSFDGDDDYITITPPTKLLTNTGTVEVWYKSVDAGNPFSIGDKDTSLTDVYWLQHDNVGNFIVQAFSSTFANFTLTTSSGTFANDTWYHLVVQSDGSTITLYQNTTARALTETAGTNTGDWFGDMANVDHALLGAENRAGNYVNDFEGIIGEIRYYSLPLTPTEISSNYNATKWKYDGSTEYFEYDLVGAGVPNNANDWSLYNNNVMPYSDNTSISVNGTVELWFRPNDIISGTTLPDRATSVANDGTFIWGSNPDGVTVLMGGLVSSSQPSPGETVDDPPPDIMPGVEVTDWYIEPDVGGALLTNPMRPFVTIMSDTTTLTELQAWRLLGTALVLMVLVGTARAVRGHLGIASIATGAIILGLVVWTIYPMWTLVFAVVMFIGGLIAERTPSV